MMMKIQSRLLLPALLVAAALPLAGCRSSMSPDPVAVRMQQDAANTGTPMTCAPNSNKFNPTVCVDNSGNVQPASPLPMHSQNNGNGNRIVWRTTNNANLAITLGTGCSGVITLSSPCNGTSPVCTGSTVPLAVGSCKYTTAVTGGGTVDPVIDTDSCCPPPMEEPKKP